MLSRLGSSIFIASEVNHPNMARISSLHKPKGGKKGPTTVKILILLIIFTFVYHYIRLVYRIIVLKEDNLPYTSTSDKDQQIIRPSVSVSHNARPPACTAVQKSTIMKQLTPTKCTKEFPPFYQKCSLTKATKCPKQSWITSYYQDLNSSNDIQDKGDLSKSFVAVYVGCNKGYDAVNTLRMGTRNSRFNKDDWHNELQESYGSVCGQNGSDSEFPLLSSSKSTDDKNIIKGSVYCIEPMPTTAQNLMSSAKNLGWDNQLFVTHAAISNKVGSAYFEVSNALVGEENKGLGTCELAAKVNPEAFKKNCKKVDVYTLDYYMDNISNEKSDSLIDLLSIDVEGYDFDVMIGGQKTLPRTKYLEFEYNWMGAWANQELIDAIKMLDSHHFTCYWAGMENLWRVDESCWLDHYNYHAWSNVACVNRNLDPLLAKRMEDLFLRTLNDKDSIQY